MKLEFTNRDQTRLTLAKLGLHTFFLYTFVNNSLSRILLIASLLIASKIGELLESYQEYPTKSAG
jgi:hypothetical protein